MIFDQIEYAKKQSEHEGNLFLVNNIICHLKKKQYTDFALNLPATVKSGSGKLNIDLAAVKVVDGEISEAMILDTKCGKNADLAQLERYHNAEKDTLESHFEKKIPHFQVGVVCYAENLDNMIKQIRSKAASSKKLNQTTILSFNKEAHRLELVTGKPSQKVEDFERCEVKTRARHLVHVIPDADEILWLKFIFMNIFEEMNSSNGKYFTVDDIYKIKINEVNTYLDKEKLRRTIVLGKMIGLAKHDTNDGMFELDVSLGNALSEKRFMEILSDPVKCLTEKFRDAAEAERTLKYELKLLSSLPKPL
jgi:hypothetical protein